MSADIWVYIAGPYTHDDPIENARKAILAAEEVQSAMPWLLPIVPHNNLIWNLVAPHSLEHYYAYDLRILERCDALLRIPGFSPGADAEVAFAKDLDIPCFWEMKDLFVWAAEYVESQT